MKRITHDFETRSRCDLKKAGAFKYSLDPSTQPTCLAFKIHGEERTYLLDFDLINRKWKDVPGRYRDLWTDLIGDDYEFSAHNSFFERCIYDNILVKRYGWPAIDPRRRRCTAAKAAAAGLPRSLAGAGEALKLTVQKDWRGYAAVMKTCKPTKQYGDWHKMMAAVEERRYRGHKLTPKQQKFIDSLRYQTRPLEFLGPEQDPHTWNTLYEYCKIDVLAEEQIDLALPDLNPTEQEIWNLNQELNWRGLRIDIPVVKKIIGIMEHEAKISTDELDSLTMGLVTKPGSRKSILEFLALEGIELPDLKKNTVADSLEGFMLTDDMHRLLEIRKNLSMTSTKKYYSMIDRAGKDDRVRDILLYHAAHTGRDGGTGIQPHNFPRGMIRVDKNRPYAAVENVIECDYDTLTLLYGESLPIVFSSILRNMIIPSPGCDLYVADFSKIEVAVCWWLSRNKPGLKVLLDGLDPYIYQAATNTGKSYEEIEQAIIRGEKWAEDARQLGKAQVLGAQFGMGGRKFQTTALDLYRLKLSLKQSIAAIKSYRGANSAVPLVWKAYEKAAIDAVQNGGVYEAGRCRFIHDRKRWYGGIRYLWIELPSGRRLPYADPQVSMRMREIERVVIHDDGTEEITTEIVGPYETLEFWKTNSKTKKWDLERTWGGTLCENITQAVARDLMMSGIVRLEKAGYNALLTIHDEGICERVHHQGSLQEFTDVLCRRPHWADLDLPIEAKGWIGARYRK